MTLDFDFPSVFLTFTLTSCPQPLTSPYRCDSSVLPTQRDLDAATCPRLIHTSPSACSLLPLTLSTP